MNDRATKSRRLGLADSAQRLLTGSAFFSALSVPEIERIKHDWTTRAIETGELICKKGWPADAWIGVANGIIKIENISVDGRPTTLTNFSRGCWFGEGTLLKKDLWPYGAVAVVPSEVVLIPATTFDWLLNRNLGFNRFLLNQLNARLAQFVERCEHVRLHDADHHVAHCLAELVDPRLYPKTERNLTLSQESLARLSGVSRSVVSRVLLKLEKDGLLRADYRSITLLDPEGLRKYSDL
jgi:CRP/FNR family cyclic AMP-dependent transcriptional regulator